MNLSRLAQLLSPRRYSACQRLFHNPGQAHWHLTFLHKQPFAVTHRNGQTLTFARAAGDQHLWDWLLTQPTTAVEFTESGQIRFDYQGQRIFLRPGTKDFYVFEEIFLRDCYRLHDQPPQLGTVIDLGGNVGLFSLALLNRARRILTVEAVQSNLYQAAKNLGANGGTLDNLLHYAVTGKSGETAVLRVAGRHTGQHSLYAAWTGTATEVVEERVPTITLADLLEQTGVAEVDLLKCDVEGAEYEILLATPLSVLRRIKRLLLELHFLDEPTISGSVPRLLSHLERAGFPLAPQVPTQPRVGTVALLAGTSNAAFPHMARVA